MRLPGVGGKIAGGEARTDESRGPIPSLNGARGRGAEEVEPRDEADGVAPR
jgi:hypothetical protein